MTPRSFLPRLTLIAFAAGPSVLACAQLLGVEDFSAPSDGGSADALADATSADATDAATSDAGIDAPCIPCSSAEPPATCTVVCDDTLPTSIAAGSDHVFWAGKRLDGSWSITRAASDGTMATAIYSGPAVVSALAYNPIRDELAWTLYDEPGSSTVHVATGGGIGSTQGSAPATKPAGVALSRGNIFWIFGDVNLVNFAAYGAVMNGPITTTDLGGQQPELPLAVAADFSINGQAFVYFLSGDAASSKLYYATVSAPALTATSADLGALPLLAADPSGAYFVTVSAGEAVLQSYVAGGSTTPLALGAPTANGIASSGTTIYVSVPTTATAGRVISTPNSGARSVSVFDQGSVDPGPIAVDAPAHYVYWIDRGKPARGVGARIYRRAF